MSFVKLHTVEVLKDLRVLKDQDLERNGRRVRPTRFFVKSFHSDEVEEHDGEGEKDKDFSKTWKEWLEDGHIYVPKL